MATFGDLYGNALHVELGSNDTQILFTGARRRHAINDGLRQFADLTECLRKQSTITVSSGVQEFDLNSTTILPGGDYLRMSDQGPVYQLSDTSGNIQTLAGDDFPQREVQWLDAADQGWRSTSAGSPTAWYLRPDGAALYFGLDRPANVSTSQTAQLIIPYVPNPSSMTASTSAVFAFAGVARRDLQPYQQALVHYAAHDLEKLRKNPEASDTQLQKFLGYVQRYLQATRPKGPRTVRAAKSYFKDASRRREGMGAVRGPWWYR